MLILNIDGSTYCQPMIPETYAQQLSITINRYMPLHTTVVGTVTIDENTVTITPSGEWPKQWHLEVFVYFYLSLSLSKWQ